MHPAEEHTNPHRVSDLKYQQFLLILPIFLLRVWEPVRGYLEMAEGYIKTIALDKNDEICGYEFVHMGKFMDEIKKGTEANEALKKVTGTYGRFTAEQGAVKHIDPRHE